MWQLAQSVNCTAFGSVPEIGKRSLLMFWDRLWKHELGIVVLSGLCPSWSFSPLCCPDVMNRVSLSWVWSPCLEAHYSPNQPWAKLNFSFKLWVLVIVFQQWESWPVYRNSIYCSVAPTLHILLQLHNSSLGVLHVMKIE